MCERSSGRKLPTEFKDFLLVGNGGEGFVGKEYVILWSTKEIGPFNVEYQVPTYAPGFLFFASNGGGEGFAFDFRSGVPSIVMMPWVGMDPAEAIPLSSGFNDFLSGLANEEFDI